MAFNQLLVATLPLACSVLGSLVTARPSSTDPFHAFGFDKPNWFNDHPYDSLKHGTDPIPSIVKKLPIEDKSFKKSAMPLLNTPYCQEITAKDSRTKCYKCKDPSNGSVYEHCSYSSDRPKVRGSRSNGAALATSSFDSAIAASTHSEPSTYRFGDDYFKTESTEQEQAELEASSSDNCKRERRDSMLCMVCKDPKTNGKYEQCSYVGSQPSKQQRQPKAKARKYREPRREEPRRSKEPKSERQRKHQHRHRDLDPEKEPTYSEEAKEGQGSQKTYLGYPSYIGGYGKDDEEAEDDADSPPPRSEKLKSPEKGCKSAKKNGETCTVCTDPKTGAKSEKCNYSFEPKDKAYAYSKSKSFGYPENSGPHEHGHHAGGSAGDDDADEEGYNAEAESRQESAEDYGSGYASPDYIRSESERISKKVSDEGDCREEKRDGMVCKICKDPRTGDDFEQCNYSYEPDDKVYAYSKSKHFGSPSPGGDASEYGSESEEHGQPEETSYSSSVLDYIPKPSESQHSSVYSSFATPSPSVKEQDSGGGAGSRVDSGFHDASKRRAEIEKIARTMGAQNRSKCGKTYRGGMTCYSCKDDKGFSDEECVFVTEPEHRSSSTVHVTSRPTATTTSTTTTTTASSSSSSSSTTTTGGSGRRRRRRRSHEDTKKEDTHEQVPLLDEELHEAEPYDYVAETRPLYDKVLGLTLPAYMINRSKQELEFDRSVENSQF